MNQGKRDWLRILVGTGVLATAPGCWFDTIEGSGIAAEDVRVVDPFDRVLVTAGLHAEVTEGPASVVVRGDDNIVPHVMTTVSDGRLSIEPGADFDPVVPLVVSVSTPDLVGGRLEAGGRLRITDVEADVFSLSLDAGGDVSGSGVANHLRVTLTAGGTIDAIEFPSAHVTVQGSAGGTMSVTALEGVDGSVKSGSMARVHGAPPSRQVSTSSGGKVRYVGD